MQTNEPQSDRPRSRISCTAQHQLVQYRFNRSAWDKWMATMITTTTWTIVTKCVLLLTLVASNVFGQHDPHHLPNRTGIVHLFEWRFDDVANECERFLAPNGYGGVQVSPVTENAVVANRPWWERYQPISYQIVTRSGDESAFRAMVGRCNRVGVRIYVDIIINHMAAGGGDVRGTGGSRANVTARSYPSVPFEQRDFHKSCAINDYNDKYQVRNCELVGLPDLDQSNEEVRGLAVAFLNKLISIGVAGFRFDAAKHMWPEDLKVIYDRINDLPPNIFPERGRPFIYQEVIDLGGEAIKKTEYNRMGAVTEFKFSAEISGAFNGHNQLRWMRTWGESWGFLPSKDALVFVDNHDNQRGGNGILTYKQPQPYKMAVAFMLAHPFGVPRIMSSFAFADKEQGPPASPDGNITSPTFNADGTCGSGWVCEHRWPEIVSMIGFRNQVGDEPMMYWWDNGGNQIGFCRGQKGMVFFNNDQRNLENVFLTCLPEGTYCDVISGKKEGDRCTGRSIVIDSGGHADIKLEPNIGILAFHVGAKL